MEKALKLYNSKGAFPSAENQIEILGFNYDAKRMGGAPIITATVMHGSCLDGVWTDDVYVEFNGEKYYLKQTPTSSFSNADARYKHDCEFVSERIKLDNVYLFDTVVGDPQGYDKPISNSSVFSFFGNIREFAKRLNASLQYSKLQTKNDDGTYSGYIVVVNDDVDNEEKLLSFSNVPFSTALQESYNQFEIPYYFVGKEIHFGYWQNVITDSFRYGVDKELLSITKTNASQKVVTRCTGTGASENIPYYYPNPHPQGELKAQYQVVGTTDKIDGIVNIVDDALFANKIKYSDTIEYVEHEVPTIDGLRVEFYQIKDYKTYKDTVPNKGLLDTSWINDEEWYLAPKANFTEALKEKFSTALLGSYMTYDYGLGQSINLSKDNNAIAFRITFDKKYFAPEKTSYDIMRDKKFTLTFKNLDGRMWDTQTPIKIIARDDFYYPTEHEVGELTYKDGVWSTETYFYIPDYLSDYDQAIYVVFELNDIPRNGKTIKPTIDIEFYEKQLKYDWEIENGKYVDLSDCGLSIGKTKQKVGDIISFEQVSYVQPMQTLMPPVYWESNGTERFYNAVNYPFAYTTGYELNTDTGEYAKGDEVLNDSYINPDTGECYKFETPYSDSKRVEHIVEFPDIKPTIEGMTNNAGQPINAFLEFAYDEEDNDAIDKDGNYVHPYFYAKLPKFDSFNLFTHANEKGEVTFSMKSGNCGACNFVLGVNAESGKNDLQVNEKGELLFEDGVAKRGLPQERQNDTQNNEVWVALKKDNSTFGAIMPSAQHNYYPAAGDTFVLLNITMPIEYVKAAENRLKEEIIKYMHENNAEKFSFSIKFSRIYLAENPQILKTLNENAFIKVEYNGVKHPLYVNSFAYKMTAGEALPEITVELAETLSASMNAIQSAVSQVKTDVLDRVQKMDIAAMVAANFLSKNNEDYAKQKITFNRGLSVGTQDNEVAKIDQVGHADIESATLKQYISSPNFRDGFSGEGFKMWLDENGLAHLTVDTLTARQRMVIYEMLISKIRSVNGQLWVSAANGTIAKVVERENDFEITLEDDNTFMVGDYIRCQVFSGADFRSYWVEISGVDGGRLYVAKSEFGEVLPQEGDDVILCGSKKIGRQNAIHISATEDGQPRISLYNGIATKDLVGCLRTQLGNLDNIEDDVLNPQGDGLYSDNAYLKGEFILKNRGESVDTMFAVTEEGIKASVEQTQAEAIKGKTLLYNASFIDGLKGWLTSNEDNTYFSGNSLLFASGSMLAQSVTVSNEPVYDNVFFVNIKNGWIKQSNLYFVNKPEFNNTSFYPLYFSANVRCRTAGVLTVKLIGRQYEITTASADYALGSIYGFGTTMNYKAFVVNKPIGKGDLLVIDGENVFNFTREERFATEYKDTTNFEIMESVTVGDLNILTKEIQPTTDFIEINANYMWNGQGDFYLSFSGEADFYGLTIYTEKTEVRHKAIFEVEAGLSKFAQQNISNDGNILQESGLLVKPTGSEIYAVGNNGYASIGAYEGGKVKLTGEKIILEGDISANGYVHIDAETGKLTAKDGVFENGVFSGKVTSETGKIGGFEITKTELKSETKNSTSNTDNKLALNKEYIYFEEGKTFNDKEYTTKQCFFGAAVRTQFAEAEPIMRINIDDDKKALDFDGNEFLIVGNNVGIYIDTKGEMSNTNMYAHYGNHAIMCPSGVYSGFRMNIRTIYNDTTLSILDNFVVVNSSENVTLTLPTDAPNGQMYVIRTVNNSEKITYIEVSGSSGDVIIGLFSNEDIYKAQITNNETLTLNYCKSIKKWIATLNRI